VPERQNKRKLSSVGSVHKRQKVEGSLKYRSMTEMNSRTQNQFGKKKQKYSRDGTLQKNSFIKRKMFSSKISKKNKH
jgi:hypothetical protein